ncbi:MAG: heat-shock protein Hsp20 [Acidimicrobiales bacterium mtb01]|nr:Hsp20/alpha crystallin family protein [Actinomycetota bacterium]TEX45367.1 MAG: heat-shock protein Hsp20 [Acidimicrobiales bacterium mtb01]
MASLLRKSIFDTDWPAWPAWSTLRSPFDRNDGLIDMLEDTAIRVEEFELDKNFVIRAEVPGIDPDKDVDLSMSDGVLRLMVHRQKESRATDARHYRSEFRYGSFTRLLVLPAGASEDDIKATYEGGILEVRVPMNGAKAKEKRIAIAKR